MAVFTPIDHQSLCQISAAFALGELRAAKAVGEGSVNTIYRLETEEGVFFLRYEEKKSPTQLGVEMAFLEHLAAQGFPCPRPRIVCRQVPGAKLDPGGQCFVYPCGSSAVALTPLVTGQPLPLEKIFEPHLVQVGRLMARLHQAGGGFPGEIEDRFSAPAIGELFDQVKGELDQRQHGNYLKEIAAEISFQEGLLKTRTALPHGIIHGDVFADNLFFEASILKSLIDFDAAARRELLFDLTTAFNALCFRNEEFIWLLMKAILEGYQEIRPLEASERKEIVHVWRLSTLRFIVTRIKDFHLQPAGNTGLIFRDYRDFYRRLEIQRRLTAGEFWQRTE